MNILQLSTYPIINPLHGGQIRTDSIRKHLIENGHTVLNIAIYDEPSGVDAGVNDIAFNQNSQYYDLSNAKFLDFLTGLHAYCSDEIYYNLLSRIRSHDIDVIILEQPWLYLIARKLASTHMVKIVYSSQNIEHRLKRSMFTAKELANEEINALLKAVKKLEKQVVLGCDLIIACTQSDADEFKETLNNFGLNTSVIVAGNGVNAFSTEKETLDNWKNILPNPYPVFVGSAHEPNSTGFWQMLAPGLTFLRPNEEIVIVGGVSHILLNNEDSKAFEYLNKSHLNILGTRSLLDLQSIILNSHFIILPITEGEGSNLKTAEALESGRPIIATTKAFRGYEYAIRLPHVYIENDAIGFRNRIRQLLDEPSYTEGTPNVIKERLYWKYQLKDISNSVDKLFSN